MGSTNCKGEEAYTQNKVYFFLIVSETTDHLPEFQILNIFLIPEIVLNTWSY